MTKRMILARHGQTLANAEGRTIATTDPSLNDRGMEQANALGGLLTDTRIDLVVVSPRLRCLETAQAIVDRQSIPPEMRTEGRLIELGMGAIEGLSHAEIVQNGLNSVFRQWRQGRPPAYPEGAETFDDAAQRLVAVFDEVSALDFDTVLLIGHSHALRILLAVAVMGGTAEMHRRLFLDHATITTIFWEAGDRKSVV